MLRALLQSCRKYLAFLLCCAGGISCSKKLSAPLVPATPAVMPEIPMSSIILPLYVPMSEINRLVDTVIQQSMKDGYTVEDGYRINARIFTGISISAKDRTLNLKVPVDLEIFPKSSWNNVKGTGRIELDLDLDIDILQDRFLCRSQLRSHRWIEAPRFSILGLKIPVESIANRFLDWYKPLLTRSLDEFFDETVSLEKLRAQIRRSFEKPFYSTEDSIISVFSSPSEMSLGPMRVQEDQIVFPVAVFIENVIAGSRPTELGQALNFSIRPQLEPNVKFAVQGRIPVNYMELMLKENFEHQPMGSGISRITVEKIGMSGAGRTVEVDLQTTGAYKGRISVHFDPVFDASKGAFGLENFRMKAVEGGVLDKTKFNLIRSLAESKVKAGIEDETNKILREYRQTLESYLHGQEIYPGIILQGTLNAWNISHFGFYDHNMVFNLLADISASIRVLRINPSILQESGK